MIRLKEFLKLREQELSGNLLLGIQVFLISILIFILLVVIVFTQENKLQYVLLVLMSMIFVLSSTLMNILGKLKESVYMLIFSSILTTWAPLIIDRNILLGDTAPIYYLSLPIVLASIFVTPIFTLVIAIVQMITCIILISVSETLQNLNWISLIIYMIAITGISLTNNYIKFTHQKKIVEKEESLEEAKEEFKKLDKSK